MFAVYLAVLSLFARSHSAPLACDKLLHPHDSGNILGRWAFVAGSFQDSGAADVAKGRDSVALYFHNSSYTQAMRVNDSCRAYSHNTPLEGHMAKLQVLSFNFTGTFYHTSCTDCLVLALDKESPTYKSADLYLLSKRRKVEEKEMEEFRAQAECLNMPPPIKMDPSKELCPETKEQTEEKTA